MTDESPESNAGARPTFLQMTARMSAVKLRVLKAVRDERDDEPGREWSEAKAELTRWQAIDECGLTPIGDALLETGDSQ